MMGNLVLESGVEVPERTEKGQVSKLAREMEVGDSAFFEDAESAHSKGVGAMRQYFRRNGIKYATKTYDNGVRVWRLG